MADPVVFPDDFIEKSPLVGTDKVPVNGDRKYATLDAIAAFASNAVASTQTVTSSPATLSARDCILDDDSHDAMSPGVLTLPPITEGARHTVWTPYDGIFYSVVPDPDDVLAGVTVSGSSSYLINSQVARVVAYQLIAIEAEGELGWYIDNGAVKFINDTVFPTIVDHDARIEVLEAGTFKVVEMSATPLTVTDETLVSITATDASVAPTLPLAVKGRVIAFTKANDNAAQTIVFTRSGSDKINDVAGNLTLTLANLPSGCRRPTWIARAVDDGEWEIDTADSATLQSLYTALVALNARLSTSTGRVSQAVQSDPSAPSAGSMELYAKSMGREQPAFRGSGARAMALQPFLGRMGFTYSMPGAAAVNTNMNCIQPTHETTVSTGFGAQLAEGSSGAGLRASLRRVYVDGGTASTLNYGGYRGQNLAFWRGNASGLGGFYFTTTIALGASLPGTHALFVGLIGSTAAFAANDVPSAKTQCIFLGYDSGDSTCQIMHNDGSGTCTKIPLTHAKLSTSDVIRVTFWCAPNSSTISYLIEDLAAGTSESGTTSTSDLPTNTQFMAWHAHVNVAGVSGQAVLEWYGMYGEMGQ